MGPCMYCKSYQEATKRTYIDDEETKHRLCAVKKQFVGKSESCDSFHFANFFWCRRWECFQNHAVCMKKKITKSEDCLRCKQGKELTEIRKALSFKERGLTKHKPILIIKKKPTIQLVRRTKCP
jgi:hypothetical protein